MSIADLSDVELNAAVAREVMGWVRHPEFPAVWMCRGVRMSPDKPWSPATDIAAAFEVVERMRNLNAPYWQRFVNALVEWVHSVDPGDAEVGHFFDPTSFLLYYLTPRAISEAALAAARSER